MPKRSVTTMKISRRAMRYLENNSRPEESVDTTIRRLLSLKRNGAERVQPGFSAMKIVKVSRTVSEYILGKAKPRESRDQTLSRLLGIQGDDGNVRATKT